MNSKNVAELNLVTNEVNVLTIEGDIFSCICARLDVRVAVVGSSATEWPVSKQTRRRYSVWSRCYKSISAAE